MLNPLRGGFLAIFAAAIVALVALTRGAAAQTDEIPTLDDPVHIDELAAYLQQVSNSLCWELHRFHRQQPDFTPAYRAAKEVWSLTGNLRDDLRTGPVDAATLTDRVKRINELFTNVEKTTSNWGDGVRPPTEPPRESRVVVTPGAGVDLDIPFFGGVRVGTPRVRIDEAPPADLPQRRRFHPNARGSRRALEREIAGVRTAVNYLLEDTGVAVPEGTPPGAPPRPAAGPELGPPVKIAPAAAAKKPAVEPTKQ